jgi:hypothetical protein
MYKEKISAAPSLLLEHMRTRRHDLAMADIAHSQLQQVTSSQRAVDRQVEQSKISAPSGDLQSYAHCPNFFELEWRLLAHKLTFVPGFAGHTGWIYCSMAGILVLLGR